MKKLKLYFKNLGNLFKIQNMGRFVTFFCNSIVRSLGYVYFRLKKERKERIMDTRSYQFIISQQISTTNFLEQIKIN